MFCPQFRRQTRYFVPFPHIFARPFLFLAIFLYFVFFFLFFLKTALCGTAFTYFQMSSFIPQAGKAYPLPPDTSSNLSSALPSATDKMQCSVHSSPNTAIPAVRSHAALPSRQSFSKSLCRILCPWLPVLYTNPPNRARPAPKT